MRLSETYKKIQTNKIFLESLDFYKNLFPVILWYGVKFNNYKLEDK